MNSRLRPFLSSDKLRPTSSLPLLRSLPAHPPRAVRSFATPRQSPLTTSALVGNQPQSTCFGTTSVETSLPVFQPAAKSLSSKLPSFGRSRSRVTLTLFVPTAGRQYGTVTGKPTLGSTKAPRLEASLLYTTVVAASIIAAVFVASLWTVKDSAVNSSEPQELQEPIEVMAFEVPPGRPDNLTPEQEEKLRKLWASIFQLCGVADDDSASSTADVLASKEKEDAIAAEADAPKKKRFGVFRKKDSKSGTSTPTSTDSPAGGDDDKYGQTKHFYETLANETPESIRATIWSMVKHDHPDALVLRFLRARKWDVEKALVMLVSTMNWRHTDMHVDDDIMKNGDGAAILDEKDAKSPTRQVSQDVLAQLRMGKSFLHGTDKNGRPICVVRVRLHKQGEQCEASLERYTVYIIETARMVLETPVDTACVVFDMTGFSMANMDYTPVKFMIKCFEANYPESLGAVLVHKAPWVFQGKLIYDRLQISEKAATNWRRKGIWKIIRGWLDPVVASKVHFTNNRTELEEFIEPKHMIKELEGDEDWEYKYIEPIAGENDKMKDIETRDRLIEAREELVKKYEHATREWIRHPEGDEAKAIKAERAKLAEQLKVDYWNLDQYVRARTLYDRQGAIQGGGKTNWYSAPKAAVPSASAVSTSADDLD
ncbi:CRAL-TRIO domain-containing protein C3H8.02 [Neonectria ditissima]|uniref:CRAL-TRIO domain-containing protein C3H8.02 n=1 Tax=Neonectria ditissima TaxID=78410 RepID=A0A0P7BDJ2_9HYPO|nr:CRAL-TRIO domain-containing protein C3H8.02 [Neonectria ditissima]